MPERMPRVDELLREEISAHIARSLSDPRLGFVTVTSVSTSPDLRHAKVFVSAIGSEEQRGASLPALHFAIDETGLRGARIQQLLGSIADGAPPPETLSPLPAPVRTATAEKVRRERS